MTMQRLRLASIIYLLVPNLIFFRFWTSGIIALAGLMLYGYILSREWRDKQFGKAQEANLRDFLVLAACAGITTCVSGVSGLCYQTFDHWCHNTKFYELYKYDWPIRIPSDGPVIAYYYGFYVVPALFSKMAGAISEQAIFVWTFIGFLLGFSWMYIVLNKRIIFLFLALTIGDLPHVLKTIFYKIWGYLYEFGDFGIEAWSNFENLLWVPNQVIPTLIISGMLVYALREDIRLERMVLPVALSFWWAVFPAFTSGLLIGILIIYKWFQKKEAFDIIGVVQEVLLPCLCCVPVLVLYLSHEQAPIAGFIWQFPDRLDSRVIEYAVNIGTNVLVFSLGYRLLSGPGNRQLPGFPLYLILFFIAVFPMYRIGKVNDFLFRGLMPLLLVVGLYMYQHLSHPHGITHFLNRTRRVPLLWAVTILLAASSMIAVGRIARALCVNKATSMWLPEHIRFTPIPYETYANIYEVLKAKWSQMEADQYLGKQGSVYEEFVAPLANSGNGSSGGKD